MSYYRYVCMYCISCCLACSCGLVEDGGGAVQRSSAELAIGEGGT